MESHKNKEHALPFNSFSYRNNDFQIEEVTTDIDNHDNCYLVSSNGVVKAKIKFEKGIYYFEENDKPNIENLDIAELTISLLNKSHKNPLTKEEILNKAGIITFGKRVNEEINK